MLCIRLWFFVRKLSLSKLLSKNNIIFIGPPPDAVRAGVIKYLKKIALKANVNCIPGINKEVKSLEQAFNILKI